MVLLILVCNTPMAIYKTSDIRQTHHVRLHCYNQVLQQNEVNQVTSMWKVIYCNNVSVRYLVIALQVSNNTVLHVDTNVTVSVCPQHKDRIQNVDTCNINEQKTFGDHETWKRTHGIYESINLVEDQLMVLMFVLVKT